MAKDLPIVRCVYSEDNTSLEELLDESFRLYIIRTLAQDCTGKYNTGIN